MVVRMLTYVYWLATANAVRAAAEKIDFAIISRYSSPFIANTLQKVRCLGRPVPLGGMRLRVPMVGGGVFSDLLVSLSSKYEFIEERLNIGYEHPSLLPGHRPS